MRVGIDARKLADFGIGTYIRGLLGGLRELGGVELVAFAAKDTKIPDGIEHVVVDAPHYSIRELVAVGRAADRARLDVFHAPHYVVPVTRVPVVVTIHDLIHLHQPQRNPLAKIYARTMLRRAVRKSAAVLTVSEAVKRDLERELGARDVIVTYNGVKVEDRQSCLSPGDSDRQDCLSSTFLFVGNDKPHKNVATLLDAFARVRRELPEAMLTLVGGRFASHEGVIARGFVSDEELRTLYASALALVMPSLEEGFGLPVAEAMACGTPVIASNAAALVELAGGAALHADARDANAFAEAMLRVARDGELRASMSARGVARAAIFTWKKCAERTLEAYKIVEHRGT